MKGVRIMRKILKPALILAAVMLTVSLLPESASAGRRRGRCGNSCGSYGNSCGSSCGSACGNSCGTASGGACAVTAVQTNVVGAPAVAVNDMNPPGTRVQYQSAFQAPVNNAVVAAPAMVPVTYNAEDAPYNSFGPRNNWANQNRADRKILGLQQQSRGFNRGY
jgi:hypothetical protein